MKHRFKATLTITLFLAASHATGQDKTGFFDAPRYSVGYFGNNLWNPGITAGIGFPFFARETSPELENTVSRTLILSGNAGFYIDPGSQAAALIRGGVAYERKGRKGFILGADLQPVGIYRSFLPETFELRDDRFERISVPGNFYYAPSTGLSLGSEVDHHRVSAWYSRFSVTLLTGYNFYIMPLVGVEAGIRIKGGGEK